MGKVKSILLFSILLQLNESNAFAPLTNPSPSSTVGGRTASADILFKNSQSVLLKNNNKFHQNGKQEVQQQKFALPFSSSELVSVVDAASASLSTNEYLKRSLIETAITSGIPAIFSLVVIFFAAKQFKPSKDKKDEMNAFSPLTKNPAADLYRDLYSGDDDAGKSDPMKLLANLFKSPGPPAGGVTDGNNNRGIPAKQYITIENMNKKYDSYEYSLTAATQSKAKAAANFRAKSFDRALQLSLEGTGNSIESSLSPNAKTRLLELEKIFLMDGAVSLQVVNGIQTELTKQVIDEQMEFMGMESPFEIDPIKSNTTATDDFVLNMTATANSTTAAKAKKEIKKSSKKKNDKGNAALLKKLNEEQKKLMTLELDFIQDVVETLGSERASGLRAAFLGDIAVRGSGGILTQLQERPLTAILKSFDHSSTASPQTAGKPGEGKRLFVTKFIGDVQASQVEELREEVTSIVRSSRPGDEALVILQTGGGTVTGYGLAGAQLARFKANGMKLTVAVEQVAASGGYLMSCVADKIIASPFAVIGSIGVIQDIPNVYERLKEEGIEFQTITAGKFKRTITLTKQVTKEDLKKTKEDIENVLKLFRGWVAQNRPSLDIDKVATGETWLGTDALDMGLCDELKTVDDVLVDYVNDGWEVFEVKYTPPMVPAEPSLSALLPGSNSVDSTSGFIGNGVKWLVKTVASEIRSELSNGGIISDSSKIENRYMARDDTADRMR